VAVKVTWKPKSEDIGSSHTHIVDGLVWYGTGRLVYGQEMTKSDKIGMFYGGLLWDEGDCLYRYCQTPGPHIDIGTNHGGSARTAALAKNGNGHVYTIDPDEDECKTAAIALDALMKGWRDRITIVHNYSQTWDPPEIPTTVLIDGDHTPRGCLGDWIKYSQIATRYVLFHDNDVAHVQEVIMVARADKNWKFVEEVGKVTVFERVNHAWETGQELEDVRGTS
jgi:hypothetical protein